MSNYPNELPADFEDDEEEVESEYEISDGENEWKEPPFTELRAIPDTHEVQFAHEGPWHNDPELPMFSVSFARVYGEKERELFMIAADLMEIDSECEDYQQCAARLVDHICRKEPLEPVCDICVHQLAGCFSPVWTEDGWKLTVRPDQVAKPKLDLEDKIKGLVTF